MEVYDNHSPPMQLAAVFTDVEDGNGGSSSSSGGGGGDGSGSGSSNADNHSSYQQSHQPLLPLYAQIIVIVAYTTIIVVAVGGNSLVVATVVSRRSMRTVTNWFIVNLACADTLMATLCIPPTFIADVLLLYWPFGAALCPLVGYAQMSSVFLCAFTLVGISIDRHRAIRHPLRARLTGRQLAVAVGVIWTAALLFPLPVAIFSRLVVGGRLQSFGGNDTTVTATDGTATASTATLIVLSTDVNCEEVWPEWHWPADSWKYGYSVTIMIAQYFLPLAVLTVTYASIAYTVWLKRRPPGEPLDKRDNKMAASKKKIIKMMITVVVIYAFCWLPLHIITLAGDASTSIWTFSYIQPVWIGSHWLAMSNCCYSPFVYYWMSSNFRRGYVEIIRRAVCVCCRQRACLAAHVGDSDDKHSHGGGGGIGAAAGYGMRRGIVCCIATSSVDPDDDACGAGLSTTLVDDRMMAEPSVGQRSVAVSRSAQRQDVVQLRMLSPPVVPVVTVTVASSV